MWKKFVRDYFTFSRKDRQGVTVLVILIAIVLLLPLLFPYLRKQANIDQKAVMERVNQLNAVSSDSFYPATPNNKVSQNETERNENVKLFNFDPNTISAEDWIRLGVKEKTAFTIIKYREKGGRFHVPQDLYKIYTLPRKDADRLIPFVRISEAKAGKERVSYPEPEKKEFTYKPKAEKVLAHLDINLADTNQWKSLPGIGSKLANRIVNFREKLGGFVSIDQVGETRFLPDSTFQKIKQFLDLSEVKIATLNINEATVDELNAHPYLSRQVANAIVQYRNQHGNFKRLEDLKKIKIIDEELYNKISSYLSVL